MTDNKMYCSKHKHNLDETNSRCPMCESEQDAIQAEADYLNEQMAIEENARDADWEYYNNNNH